MPVASPLYCGGSPFFLGVTAFLTVPCRLFSGLFSVCPLGQTPVAHSLAQDVQGPRLPPVPGSSASGLWVPCPSLQFYILLFRACSENHGFLHFFFVILLSVTDVGLLRVPVLVFYRGYGFVILKSISNVISRNSGQRRSPQPIVTEPTHVTLYRAGPPSLGALTFIDEQAVKESVASEDGVFGGFWVWAKKEQRRCSRTGCSVCQRTGREVLSKG